MVFGRSGGVWGQIHWIRLPLCSFVAEGGPQMKWVVELCSKNGSYRAQKNAKADEKLQNRTVHKNLFFDNFKSYLGGLGVSGGMAWTIRSDSLELWQGLVLHSMGEVDFHVFGNIGNSLHHQIPPNWSSGLQIGPRIFLKARAPSQEL